MQQTMQNPKDISDPTTAIDMALITKGMNMDLQQQNVGNQLGHNAVQNSNIQKTANHSRNRNVVAAQAEGNGWLLLSCLLQISQKEEAGIQLNSKIFDFMAGVGAYDKIKEVNVNCTLKDNLQQASTSGTSDLNRAHVYDSDVSYEVHTILEFFIEMIYLICYTHEEQYTVILEPVYKPNTPPPTPHQQEKKKMKDDFKIRNDEVLDKQIQLEQKIKELDNILVKRGQLIQTMHMVSPNSDSFYQTERKMALGDTATCSRESLKNERIEQETKPENYAKINQLSEKQLNFFETKSLAKEVDESLAKHKVLEYEIERLLRAIFSQDIMSIVQNNSVVDTSNLQIELDRTKEKLEACIIKKEKEYAVLWNNWYKKCEEFKYDKISYDKAYNDMQQKIERLQAHLGDLKSKILDTPCISDTLDPLSQKLEDENMSLEFQCLITANHDECVFKYVNGMNSSKKNQSANVSKSVNQNKHKSNVKKSKKLGSKARLASPRPSKPRTSLRWLPTGRIFELCRKITASSNIESDSDIYVCDNASASNPQEPTSKGFPNSTSFLDRFTRLQRQNTCIHPLVVL
ncbi:hypothetical protein Tco_0893662 [Tanacetum coccineum]|uniref:Uncharacterized protein n=1 Tax=Tanacetum coccineum TaxID=301880 RepID=A0ABQ5C9F7_9ASTR